LQLFHGVEELQGFRAASAPSTGRWLGAGVAGRTAEPPERKARMVRPAVAVLGEPMILRKHPMPSGGPVGMERLARAAAPLLGCCAWAPARGKPTDLRMHATRLPKSYGGQVSSGAADERERSAARPLAVPGRCLRPAFRSRTRRSRCRGWRSANPIHDVKDQPRVRTDRCPGADVADRGVARRYEQNKNKNGGCQARTASPDRDE